MESQDLAEFVVNNSSSSLPKEVLERTKLAVVNFVANTIGANKYPQSGIIVEACKRIQDGDLPIFGSTNSAGLLGSAWANSSLSHLLDFDDTHLRTIVHPSAPVVAAALSTAMKEGEDGDTLLYSSAIGMEASIRTALALDLDERYSDWHNTSLFGTAAAALASAVIGHYDSNQTEAAFLQGLTVATGFLSNKGTMTKSFQVGRSASEGIMSAIAARSGVTVSRRILEAFGTSLSEHYDSQVITAGLGVQWHVMNNYLKPYPCGVVLHPGIDAGIEMRKKGIRPEEIASIDVYVNPIVMSLTYIMEPKTGLESKFSATHAVASALAHGPLFPEHFSDDAVSDTLTLQYRKKVRIHQVEEINRGQTRIEITRIDGSKETSEINRGPEIPSKVLEEPELKDKFHHLVNPVIGEDEAGNVWEYFIDIGRKDDLSEISELFK